MKSINDLSGHMKKKIRIVFVLLLLLLILLMGGCIVQKPLVKSHSHSDPNRAHKQFNIQMPNK